MGTDGGGGRDGGARPGRPRPGRHSAAAAASRVPQIRPVSPALPQSPASSSGIQPMPCDNTQPGPEAEAWEAPRRTGALP